MASPEMHLSTLLCLVEGSLRNIGVLSLCKGRWKRELISAHQVLLLDEDLRAIVIILLVNVRDVLKAISHRELLHVFITSHTNLTASATISLLHIELKVGVAR